MFESADVFHHFISMYGNETEKYFMQSVIKWNEKHLNSPKMHKNCSTKTIG